MNTRFQRLAIVNRGESAMRLIRAVKEVNAEGRMQLTTIALYTEEERRALFVREADEGYCIGSATYTDAQGNRKNRYLDYAALEAALKESRAEAVWLGWGFVSEHTAFAELCRELGIVFLGPSPEVMRKLGDKIGSKLLAEQAGVPVAPWSGGAVATLEEAEGMVERLGCPLMVKATAGGGGRGIRKVMEPSQLRDAFESARSEALKGFGDDTVFLETMMTGARHIEVQIIGDHQGTVWALGVRDCSVQRRNQKVIEESPSPALSPEQHEEICAAARRLGEHAGYTNAGTVEFLYDPKTQSFSFMEVNARLQVEHPVTELTTGVDLVKLQILVGQGEPLPSPTPPVPKGHAVEVRVNAEDPEQGFVPTPGQLVLFQLPGGAGVRVDTGFVEGDRVAPQFDSMLAKVIAVGADRAEAMARLRRALREMRLAVRGGASNKGFLLGLLGRREVIESDYDIGWLDRISATGGHLVSDYADVALLFAAVEAYRAEFEIERRAFLATAARGRLQMRAEVGYEIELRHRGSGYSFRVTRVGPNAYRVTIDGQRFDIQVEGYAAHQFLVQLGDCQYQALSLSDGQQTLVEINGIPHRLSRDSAGLVRAPAPAVVLAFEAKEGQLINKGDRLAVLEAMKTEMPVLAPCDGTVVRIMSAPNVQVEAGAALAVIEPRAEEDATQAAARLDFSNLPAADAGAATASGSWLAVLRPLRRIALGFDADAGELERLLKAYSALEETQYDDASRALEDDILAIFADVCELFSHRADTSQQDSDELRTSEEYFLLFLRSMDPDLAGVSPAFVTTLGRVLAYYGIHELERSPQLEDTLLWISKAHDRIATQARAVLAILDRRLALRERIGAELSEAFRDLLGRIVFVTRRRYPAVSDLAREVRYRYFDWPFFANIWEQAFAQIDADLRSATGSDAAAAEAAVVRLVECPQPLVGVFAERFPAAPEPQRELMLEVLARRHYRERPLEAFSRRTLDGVSVSEAEYSYEGRRLRLLSCYAVAGELGPVLKSVRELIAAEDDCDDVVIDCYFAGGTEGVDEDELAQRFGAVIEAAEFGRPIRRIVVAMASPGHRLGVKDDRYFTYRFPDEGLIEDRLCRGLHPMMGKRLGLWRLQEFDVERVPASDGIYLFLGKARSNPRDERLFAFAEIRDLTPIVNEHGHVERLPHLEMIVMETLAAIRQVQSHRAARERLHWNRVTLHVRPPIEIGAAAVNEAAHRLGALIEDLGLEKLSVIGRVRQTDGSLRQTVIEAVTPGGREVVVRYREPPTDPLWPLDDYTLKVVKMRQRGLLYPYEIIRTLTAGGDDAEGQFPPGSFQEYDFDEQQRLVPVDRPPGQNRSSVIVGRISHRTAKYPEGMERVLLIGDPTRGMGSLSEPECRRINAALDMAAAASMPVEWFALSAGALIAMDSGTENLDWCARVIRKIVEHTQAGHEINVVVSGVNVGAQSYWNAEATMLMHTRGILILCADGSMLLTGKKALDYSGAVSAADNQGIGGYDLIMGVNGQAQYWAADVWDACATLLRYYDHSYIAPGEAFPRRAATSDPSSRDVSPYPHGHSETSSFERIGDIFADATNPGRAKPFEIRKVMSAVIDQDHEALERWRDLREGETAVVWDAHLGGYPVCLLGIESRPIQRLGFVPMDGPDKWSSGTLFPMSSKKIARAINSASGNRPVVVLANLSGFDGSPESLRRLQLEYGAEIGRAVVNFHGPMVFCGICRYHGGAYVVFSSTLNDNLEVAALDGSYASVIGGKPAAAVVFASVVKQRTVSDPRLVEIDEAMRSADEATRPALHARWHETYEAVHAEKLAEVAREFDDTHSVRRAREVGSLDTIVPPERLRPYLVEAIERGIARITANRGGG